MLRSLPPRNPTAKVLVELDFRRRCSTIFIDFHERFHVFLMSFLMKRAAVAFEGEQKLENERLRAQIREVIADVEEKKDCAARMIT